MATYHIICAIPPLSSYMTFNQLNTIICQVSRCASNASYSSSAARTQMSIFSWEGTGVCLHVRHLFCTQCVLLWAYTPTISNAEFWQDASKNLQWRGRYAKTSNVDTKFGTQWALICTSTKFKEAQPVWHLHQMAQFLFAQAPVTPDPISSFHNLSLVFSQSSFQCTSCPSCKAWVHPRRCDFSLNKYQSLTAGFVYPISVGIPVQKKGYCNRNLSAFVCICCCK